VWSNRHTKRSVAWAILSACCVMAWAAPGWAEDEPDLPAGLKDKPSAPADEPDLPAGLGEPGKKAAPGEPGLPAGLDDGPQAPSGEPGLPAGLTDQPAASPTTKAPDPGFQWPFDLSGFWEIRGGLRTQRDRHQRDASIGETRVQLRMEKRFQPVTFKVTTDLLLDPVLDRHRVDLDRGQGFLDLREASALLRPLPFMDVKLGRQILTWGTGDLLFINDLFPKDWNSFFIGRDTEYLKAPSDAVKVSLFSELANLDVVYVPAFDADRFIDGRRVSYWNSALDRRTGRDVVVRADRPNRWFRDDELALRVYKNVHGYELAGYGYYGFWKSPGGMDVVRNRATFPDLAVYGASVRGTVFKGIGNIEVGYYDSLDERDGDDALVRNSEFRFLIGYEQEVAEDLTAGLQYYWEWMVDHNAYERTLPPGVPGADELRQVITVRLKKLLLGQNLELGLFAYYSPSDDDAYLRPKVKYKIDDHWSVEVGANVFVGSHAHTFFGQFDRCTNIYTGLRYGF